MGFLNIFFCPSANKKTFFHLAIGSSFAEKSLPIKMLLRIRNSFFEKRNKAKEVIKKNNIWERSAIFIE